MDGFDRLLRCTGTWAGRNAVQPTATDVPNESASTLLVTPMLRDTFVRIDQSWSWNDEPQLGSMLIGRGGAPGAATMHWIDTWHNGIRVMPLTGRFEPDGRLIVHGTFEVTDSPDWGWSIAITPSEDDRQVTIEMACIDPATGRPDGGVRGEFARFV